MPVRPLPVAIGLRRLDRKLTRSVIITIGTGSLSAAAFSYLYASSALALMLPGILTGVGRALLEPSLFTLAGDRISEKERLSGAAVILSFVDLGTIIAAPLFGLLSTALGFDRLFVMVSLGLGATAILGFWSTLQIKRPRLTGQRTGSGSSGHSCKWLKVLVTGELHGLAINYLTELETVELVYLPDCSRIELLDQITDTNILICRIETQVDAELLTVAKELEVVGTATLVKIIWM